jgi:quercetin 2,3-dioxygenase
MSNLDSAPVVTSSAECAAAAVEPVREVLQARQVDLGEGTPVRRLLPKRQRATIGAWCFVDHFGPLDVAGGRGMWVPPHPHIGLQTVTWLVEGEILHRDSEGNEQRIRPGQLNLMTAGRGIAHSEESLPDHPAVLHGVQLWTALPPGPDHVTPSFDHLPALPQVETDGMRITVMVGEMRGVRSEARTYSDLLGLDLDVARATDDDLPVRPDFEHGAIVLSGQAAIDGVTLRPGALLYLGTGRTRLAVRAPGPARILLLGGEPFGLPLFMWWNFVAHSMEEIVEAREDWITGRRFGEVRGFAGPRLDAPPMLPGRLKPRGGPQRADPRDARDG